MTLKDKRRQDTWQFEQMGEELFVYDEEDIKEFIKELKEELSNYFEYDNSSFNKVIDKLTGFEEESKEREWVSEEEAKKILFKEEEE